MDINNNNNNNNNFSFINNPESFHVFIVGNCEEWPENRREQGDLALYHEYLNAGVPSEQILYIQDDDCTITNCQEQLERFVEAIQEDDETTTSTFMFYYGGHGIPRGFKTIGGIWSYQQVCETIHQRYKGKRILFLLDCCDSGNLSEYIPTTSSTTNNNNNMSDGVEKQYVLFANAPPFISASDEGDEWIVTNSWIRGMRCQELPTLTLMMEFFVDRLALLLGDQGFCFLTYTNKQDPTTSWVPSIDRTWMPKRMDWISSASSTREKTLDWPSLQYNIPKEARADSHDGGCLVGDSVVCKHLGGPIPNSSLQFMPPIWVYGTVTEVMDSRLVKVQVHHPAKPLETWNVVSDQKHLISGIWMAQQWSLPSAFYKAQVQLAKDWKYLHFSALSVDTIVTVQERPGITPVPPARQAIIVDWRKFNWKLFCLPIPRRSRTTIEEVKDNQDDDDDDDSDEESSTSSSSSEDEEAVESPYHNYDTTRLVQKTNDEEETLEGMVFGGHVPIRWIDTGEYALVSLLHIVSPELDLQDILPEWNRKDTLPLMELQKKGPEACRQEIQNRQRQSLLDGMETASKTVVNVRTHVVCRKSVKAYWPNEDKWYKAKLIHFQDAATDLSLPLLASHAQFPLQGPFTPLYYNEDEERILTPVYFIRKGKNRLCC